MGGQDPSAEEIVARRIEVLKMAMAEVGFPVLRNARFDAFQGDPYGFTWTMPEGSSLEQNYRASLLSQMAAPGTRGATCWEHWNDGAGELCDQMSPAEALQFRACRSAQRRAAAGREREAPAPPLPAPTA